MGKIEPCVKWVGGKRRLYKEIQKYLPKDYRNYYEPFFGGGSVLFNIKPKRAFINDLNVELMDMYKCIKKQDTLSKMLKLLNKHKKKHSIDYFKEIRELDRDKIIYNSLMLEERSARLIYLNKTCFNGLYRVNKKNEFNAPCDIQRVDKEINIIDKDNIVRMHDYFNENEIYISSLDFEIALQSAKEKDLIYIDPPYYGVYTSYTKNSFTKEDQERLAKVFKDLTTRGCYIILSNSDCDFIRDLYKEYTLVSVTTTRNINPLTETRKNNKELLIMNF